MIIIKGTQQRRLFKAFSRQTILEVGGVLLNLFLQL